MYRNAVRDVSPPDLHLLTPSTSLAKAEILLAVSTLLRRMDLELYETTVEDVAIKHDIFIPFPRMDSKGVRVLIKG